MLNSKQFLETVKKEVKASFVAYVQEKDKYYIRVIIDKVKSDFEIVGTPQDATQESYQRVLTIIKNYYATVV